MHIFLLAENQQQAHSACTFIDVRVAHVACIDVCDSTRYIEKGIAGQARNDSFERNDRSLRNDRHANIMSRN